MLSHHLFGDGQGTVKSGAFPLGEFTLEGNSFAPAGDEVLPFWLLTHFGAKFNDHDEDADRQRRKEEDEEKKSQERRGE